MKIHPRGGVKEGNGETRGAIGKISIPIWRIN